MTNKSKNSESVDVTQLLQEFKDALEDDLKPVREVSSKVESLESVVNESVRSLDQKGREIDGKLESMRGFPRKMYASMIGEQCDRSELFWKVFHTVFMSRATAFNSPISKYVSETTNEKTHRQIQSELTSILELVRILVELLEQHFGTVVNESKST